MTQKKTISLLCSALVLMLAAVVPNQLIYANEKHLNDIGKFGKWQPIEIKLAGPDSEASGSPNPFAISVDMTFTSPGGRTYRVPGFYDGDGQGVSNGNIWKVRFAADEVGKWVFHSRSEEPMLNGYSGSFDATEQSAEALGFYRWGRLEAVGTAENRIRYLKFRDGPYWLKAGCDDPENFLGNFRFYNSLTKRRAVVDYLADKGVNSLYIMTHNLDGDHNDVWPWLGDSPEEAKSNSGMNSRFDVARLEEWRILFKYMQIKGVVPYLVLEDDSAWSGYDHRRYYREMVARFGDLPAVIFNFCEEYNESYDLSSALSFMRLLKDMDPYDHPRGIHNVNLPNDKYIGSPVVDFTAIQTNGNDPLKHNKMAVEWIRRCRKSQQRILMIGFDEPRPLLDRRGWWSAYMGGAVWEAHLDRPYDRPISTWQTIWNQLGGARAFMEILPFWEMVPGNHLVVSGRAFCLAKTGHIYAVYIYKGGNIKLQLGDGHGYRFEWWNPTNNRRGQFQDGGVVSGGMREFRPPGNGDWALRIEKMN